MFGIPSEGWVAVAIWLAVNIIPWAYSLYLMKRIDDSGVERWGATKK